MVVQARRQVDIAEPRDGKPKSRVHRARAAGGRSTDGGRTAENGRPSHAELVNGTVGILCTGRSTRRWRVAVVVDAVRVWVAIAIAAAAPGSLLSGACIGRIAGWGRSKGRYMALVNDIHVTGGTVVSSYL